MGDGFSLCSLAISKGVVNVKNAVKDGGFFAFAQGSLEGVSERENRW